ncbi:hypothetical protein DQ384_26315 [Sphaerisporangium album]|uniref:Uncharacterized protein n=1 Tax=Sphaerisporangium album TaxID=509200 RepID=A0A367FC20_9ACTN|nr:hypothetical protein [Sphaerisporangium album]RCG27235.1 hypothetical protein DQ384_26315 [Sphaerisporangium album]
MSGVQVGVLVDVTIKGVPLAGVDRYGCVTITAEAGDGGPASFHMPPQAAVGRADTSEAIGELPAGDQGDRTAKILELLDRLEAEDVISPYVAATARKVAGLPPRHWPPQPGDVWHDGYPFGSPLWFAQVLHEIGHSELVMVPTERSPGTTGVKAPEEFLEYACDEIALVYRRKDGDQ